MIILNYLLIITAINVATKAEIHPVRNQMNTNKVNAINVRNQVNAINVRNQVNAIEVINQMNTSEVRNQMNTDGKSNKVNTNESIDIQLISNYQLSVNKANKQVNTNKVSDQVNPNGKSNKVRTQMNTNKVSKQVNTNEVSNKVNTNEVNLSSLSKVELEARKAEIEKLLNKFDCKSINVITSEPKEEDSLNLKNKKSKRKKSKCDSSKCDSCCLGLAMFFDCICY